MNTYKVKIILKPPWLFTRNANIIEVIESDKNYADFYKYFVDRHNKFMEHMGGKTVDIEILQLN